LPITIAASGDPTDPDIPDLASNLIAINPNDPLSFGGGNPVTQIGGTPKDSTKPCDANHLDNCVVTVASVQKLGANTGTGNPNCDKTLLNGTPSSQCIKITYTADRTGSTGFRPGIFVVLSVNFNKDANTIIGNNLLT